ncbi:protein-disulfide reductase [Verminephrobacter aporrectodeae subsp. tuberculatae]|uniref:protein-disulfide reductase DsbD family protein n=1 Tax=Verminephrobacter aporrectodeae TaxID=1110389 RepID=UPI00224384CF|nr:thioredoxin family protein [Verminephrobacter aporrectodeae]MCW8164970.1 protein-disulfide reductase [Verminephrobacter aporrectodeae subsp. tuberculatae]MCW8167918.1 protein-disulfide reductase [Verminephrobacter aporrectodeae subsp. tuberculatae]
MHQRLLHRLAATLLLAAASAPWSSACAQFAPPSGAPGSSVLTTPHVRAELLAHAPQGVAPGEPLWLGLSLTHQPGWHSYWKNPGDSGLPTTLDWVLPAGLDPGEIAWPLPGKIRVGTLTNYGYEGRVLLPVPVTVGSGFAPGPLAQDVHVRLHATWLVCSKECIPEAGEFTLQLPIKSSTALSAAAFEAAREAQPRAVDSSSVSDNQARLDGNALQIRVAGLPAALRGRTLDLFPETPATIAAAGPWTQSWNGGLWTARLPLSEQRSSSNPTALPVVLAERTPENAQRPGYRAELQVLGAWPSPAPEAGVPPALGAALEANAARAAGLENVPAAAGSGASLPALTLALLGALLGGLILNLMPCVLPVLAIKVTGLARNARDRRARRADGVAYTAGVLLCFMALGALMLGLRAAGQAVGWGFQLQSPAMVAALAALFTLIALNLAGVFRFGQILPTSLASVQAQHPVADAFLGGVLAVAVASPCTAPFMGASLGLAATLPAPQALAVFAALGLGLALPYLAASFAPGVARALPRPGAWMDILRKLMAFPMLATVVWLVWVLGQQSGIDGAGALLILLLGLGMLVWALALPGRARLWTGTAAGAVLALLVWAFAPHITNGAAPAAGESAASTGQNWQAWTPGAVQQTVASGRPVFVDFTAAWCITCQYNKKTTLANAAVLADLAAKNVALLRADWTRRDPAISAALTALGRSGVPVYVFYRPGRPPVVLTEVLRVDEVRSLIATL